MSTQRKTQEVSFIINARDGKPVSLACVINKKPYTLQASNPCFNMVVKELKAAEPSGDKILKLMNKQQALIAYSQEKVVEKDGKFYYQGQELQNSLVNRIQEFMKMDLPWTYMFKFLVRLVKNPSESAKARLHAFIENEGITYTPDGCFLGYKGAQANFWSKHTGHHTMISGQQNEKGEIFYGPGEKVRVPREEVVEDPHSDCARGLHVGSFSYASGWAGHDGALVLVKVAPEDVVSVTHRSREVMRVCAYEVVQPLAIRQALQQAFEPQFSEHTVEAEAQSAPSKRVRPTKASRRTAKRAKAARRKR